MRIIKVNATNSSNILAREWYQANKNSAPLCISVQEQTAGRGQRGASWISNSGQNLTFSILYPSPKVVVNSQFMLSAGIGLAILDALEQQGFKNLKLKWPNDIMAASFKIGGILIENILGNGSISASIIGIGLNVNQTSFPDLPRASSLKLLKGQDFILEELLAVLLNTIEIFMDKLFENTASEILKNYEKVLFRKNKVSTFQLPSGQLLTGIIKGISPQGLLKVEVEEGSIRMFDLKQLKLLY